MRSVVVRTEYSTRGKNFNRWSFLFHNTDLSCRRLRAENEVFRQIEGILHISCRVILGGIQRREVVVVRFNFRAFKYLKAHTCENVDKLVLYKRDRVQSPCLVLFTGHGNINTLVCVLLFHFHLTHNHFARLKHSLYLLLKLVDHFTECRTIFLCDILHSAHNPFQLRLILYLQFVKRPTRLRLFDGFGQLRKQSFQFFFHIFPPNFVRLFLTM